MNYSYTPSFYSDEVFFNEYLGRTSYYLKLQNITKKVISFCKPKKVLELGSALGTTISNLAREFPITHFTGVDIREDVINESKIKYSDISNLHFVSSDMCKFVEKDLKQYDFVFLLYSFHHIVDPLSNKEEFLEKLYKNLAPGSYVFVTETFLPDNDDVWTDVPSLFKARSIEGYSSTYWEALNSLKQRDINFAKKVASTSLREESLAGDLVEKRDSEYLVEFGWLIELCKKIGFHIVISEPVNCINEKAILLMR